jgi:hypothetical protein
MYTFVGGANISCLPSIMMQNVLLQIIFTSPEVFCNHLSIHLIQMVLLLLLLAKEQKERLWYVGCTLGLKCINDMGLQGE